MSVKVPFGSANNYNTQIHNSLKKQKNSLNMLSAREYAACAGCLNV